MLNDLTIGTDSVKLNDYMDQIKAIVLEQVGNELDATDDLINTINSGWVGNSKDRFCNLFFAQKDAIKQDLIQEYNDLGSRINELCAEYFVQDDRLIDE